MNCKMDISSTNNIEPDSWEDRTSDHKNSAEQPGEQLSNSFSKLNVDAAPFVPNMNIHAPVFVPSFLGNNIDAHSESGWL